MSRLISSRRIGWEPTAHSKWQAYLPTSSVGDNFSDERIDSGWTLVERGATISGTYSWTEKWGGMRFHRTSATNWAGRDLNAYMRSGTMSAGDWIEGAWSSQSSSYLFPLLIMADGNTWNAGNQICAWVFSNITRGYPSTARLLSMTNYNTLSTNSGDWSWQFPPYGEVIYCRLKFKTAGSPNTYSLEASGDGVNWYEALTLTASWTPTHVGFGVVSWEVGTPPDWCSFYYFDSSVA